MQGLPLPWRVEVSTLRTCDGAAKPSASDGIDARGECTLLLALTRGDVEAAEQLLDAGAAGAHGLTGAVATGNAAVRADLAGARGEAAAAYGDAARLLRAALADVAADDSVYPQLASQYDARAACLAAAVAADAADSGAGVAPPAPADGPRRAPHEEATMPMVLDVGAPPHQQPQAWVDGAAAPPRPAVRGQGLVRAALWRASLAPPVRLALLEVLLRRRKGQLPVDVDDVDPRDGRGVLHALLAGGGLPADAPAAGAASATAASPLAAAVALLLEGGARVGLRSHALDSPLHVACAAGAPLPLIRLLLHASADVSPPNRRAETPLHLLAASSSFEATRAARVLVEGGALLGARDGGGDTPLHRAVVCGNLPLACELVRAGAVVTDANGAGHTALDLAAWQGGAQLERLLEAIAAPPPWVPDDAASACMVCRASFSTRRRRHHCRHCGSAVCHRCGSHRVPIPKFQQWRPVRCCRVCVAVVGPPLAAGAAARSRSPSECSGSGGGGRRRQPAAAAATGVGRAARAAPFGRRAPRRRRRLVVGRRVVVAALVDRLVLGDAALGRRDRPRAGIRARLGLELSRRRRAARGLRAHAAVAAVVALHQRGRGRPDVIFPAYITLRPNTVSSNPLPDLLSLAAAEPELGLLLLPDDLEHDRARRGARGGSPPARAW